MFVYFIELYMALNRLPEHGLIGSLSAFLVFILYVAKLIHPYSFFNLSLDFTYAHLCR